MRISFYGACREVTGANFLLEVGGRRILLDCGIFQGTHLAEERNYAPFPYDPKTIDFVIVGHAHLDHTGKLPKLIKGGFVGKIFATAPTKELTELVLLDNYKLMSEEAQRDNHKPLYEQADVFKAIELFESLEYGETLEISGGLKITLKNAGHILGSAITLVDFEGKKLVYTSDLGNSNSTLLASPDYFESCEAVICESTYGGREHEDESRKSQKLSEIISGTIAHNGILMIPSFAVERTQELLHDINRFCTIENCEKPTFFLDSPLASKATAVFKKYPEYLAQKLRADNPDNDFFGLDRVKITSTVEESKAIDDFPNPKVIIAGSGMMNGGRILHHMRKYLPDANNTLLIVGYQAQGSLGRRIVEGETRVKIFGETVEVGATVKKMSSYSAHADNSQFLEWLSKIKDMKHIFLVHGESKQAIALFREIKSKLSVETIIPQQGESYEI